MRNLSSILKQSKRQKSAATSQDRQHLSFITTRFLKVATNATLGSSVHTKEISRSRISLISSSANRTQVSAPQKSVLGGESQCGGYSEDLWQHVTQLVKHFLRNCLEKKPKQHTGKLWLFVAWKNCLSQLCFLEFKRISAVQKTTKIIFKLCLIILLNSVKRLT